MQIVISYDFNFLYLIFFILQISEYELFIGKNKRYNSIYFHKKYEIINVSNNQKSC